MQLSPQEADARAREPMAAERREQLLASPQNQVSWYALNSLAEHDPDAAWAVWERLKRDAQAELASGHRAARAVEFCALELLHQRTMCEATRERTQIERDRAWEPPHLNYAEAVEEAATMVDRWNRLFLRTLRQLRDLRRYAPSVVVGNVGQLNIAQQQMNLAHTRENTE